MSVDLNVLAAIGAMAVATYLTRITGYLLANRLQFGPRGQAVVDAIPGAVLVAVIAPLVANGGPATWLAAVITGLCAWRAPMIVTIGVGIVSAAFLRQVLG